MVKDLVLDKQEEATRIILESYPECVGCGGHATRTNNTLCQSCWNDAECFDNE